jgi:hypothetical protein
MAVLHNYCPHLFKCYPVHFSVILVRTFFVLCANNIISGVRHAVRAMRKKLALSSDGGVPGSKQCKRCYGDTYDAVCGVSRVQNHRAVKAAVTFLVVQRLPSQ